MKQRVLLLLLACCIAITSIAQTRPNTGLIKISKKADSLIHKINAVECCKFNGAEMIQLFCGSILIKETQANNTGKEVFEFRSWLLS